MPGLALVTGANGFLGSHLVDLLLENSEWSVRGLVRRTSDLRFLDNKQIELTYGDVTDAPEKLRDAVNDCDVVFHVAGVTKAVDRGVFDNVNRGGTENIFEACLLANRAPSRVVLVSSAGVMGPSPTNDPLVEGAPLNPLTEYGRSKLAGEKIARKYGDRVAFSIIRPGGIYGPRDMEFLPVFRSVKRRLLTLFGLSVGQYNLCHVRDVARAVILAANAPEAKSEVFLVGGQNTNQVELGRILAHVLGKRLLVPVVLPKTLIRAAGILSSGMGKLTGKARLFTYDNTKRLLARNWTLDLSKAKRVLGYQPEFDLEWGLADTAAWYVEQGLL